MGADADLIIVYRKNVWEIERQLNEGDSTLKVEDKEAETPPVGGAPRFPIDVSLSISRAPALGETAELTYTMTSLSRKNLSNFSGRIVLTGGLEYVSGDPYWEGDLLPNQTVQFKAVVKAVKTGNWSIHAWPAAGYGD